MTDIMNFFFDLVWKINPILYFIQIPLAVAGVCRILWLILAIVKLIQHYMNKSKDKKTA